MTRGISTLLEPTSTVDLTRWGWEPFSNLWHRDQIQANLLTSLLQLKPGVRSAASYMDSNARDPLTLIGKNQTWHPPSASALLDNEVELSHEPWMIDRRLRPDKPIDQHRIPPIHCGD